MLAVVVVEEIACGRRPPENWKTRIARPTAMSDSLVMRLSFFFSSSHRYTSPYILFLFPSYSVCHPFLLPPPLLPLEVLFPYIYTYMERQLSTIFQRRRWRETTKGYPVWTRKFVTTAAASIKKNDETGNRSERVASLDR